MSSLGTAEQDVNILTWYVNYLGKEAKSAKPRKKKSGEPSKLEPATVRLYGQAVIT